MNKENYITQYSSEIEFEIIGKMPSLNEFISKINHNRYSGNTFKQQLEHDIQMQILKQVREKGIEHLLPLKQQADFEFTYYEKTQKRDKDNIASCKKFLFDALVKRGVINNDGWKWVGDFKENFVLDKSEYKVKIVIREKKKEN